VTVVGDELRVQARSAEPVASGPVAGVTSFRAPACRRDVSPGGSVPGTPGGGVPPSPSGRFRRVPRLRQLRPRRPRLRRRWAASLRRVAVRRTLGRTVFERAGPRRLPGGPGPKIVQILVRGGKTRHRRDGRLLPRRQAGRHLRPGSCGATSPPLGLGSLRGPPPRTGAGRRPARATFVAVVVERPTVADLEFRGNKKLTTSQLKDKLKEGKAEIKVGSPIALRDVSKAKATLLEAYKAEASGR